MAIDTVIVAIGQGPNPILTNSTEGLELNKRGNIVADEKGQTSLPYVFAGGDIVTGAAPSSKPWAPERTPPLPSTHISRLRLNVLIKTLTYLRRRFSWVRPAWVTTRW